MRNFSIEGGPHLRVGGCGAGQQAFAVDNLLDFPHSRMRAVGGVAFEEGDVHIGVPVLIVVLNVVVVDKLAGAIDIGRGIAPQDHIHAVHIRDTVLDVLGLPERYVLKQDASDAGIGKFLLHDIDRLGRRRVVREIFGQVIVDVDQRDAQQAEHKQDGKNLFNPSPFVDNQFYRAVALLFFHK